MSKRVYQVTALAILIGAPILVNLISNALPGLPHAAAETRPEAPATPPSATPPTPLPMPEPGGPSADAVIDATPALDAEGIAPDAVSNDVVPPAPPVPPVVAEPVVQPVPAAN